MNSGIENIRLYSQYILKKMAKTDDNEVLEKLRLLKKSDPWYNIGKNWSEVPYWTPV
jgi:hypothetical protein